VAVLFLVFSYFFHPLYVPYVLLATTIFSWEIFIIFFTNVSIALFIRFTTAVVLLAAVHTACLFVYWQRSVADTNFFNIKLEN